MLIDSIAGTLADIAGRDARELTANAVLLLQMGDVAPAVLVNIRTPGRGMEIVVLSGTTGKPPVGFS